MERLPAAAGCRAPRSALHRHRARARRSRARGVVRCESRAVVRVSNTGRVHGLHRRRRDRPGPAAPRSRRSPPTSSGSAADDDRGPWRHRGVVARARRLWQPADRHRRRLRAARRARGRRRERRSSRPPSRGRRARSRASRTARCASSARRSFGQARRALAHPQGRAGLSASPAGIEPGLDANVNWRPDPLAYANACHAAEVEVDVDTGGVRILKYWRCPGRGTLDQCDGRGSRSRRRGAWHRRRAVGVDGIR